MSRGFQLQVKSITSPVWYVDTGAYSQRPQLTKSHSVSELRESIQKAADVRTLSHTLHVRIVTDDGDPVERWKIKPGRAKKAWRKW